MNKISHYFPLSSGHSQTNAGAGGALGNYNVKTRAKILRHKFALLWKSKRILSGILGISKNIMGCMCNTLGGYVELEKSDGHANFGGVVTCKSKHVCPVESPSIARVEARYIQEAIYKCRKSGKDVYMLTLTFRHHNKMSLRYCMDAFHSALQRFWRSGSVRRFYSTYFEGRITALEETWSPSSGWHVHEHILLFGERGLCGNPLVGVDAFFSRHWLAALSAAGLDGVEGVASEFQSASAVKNYLTKMSMELTMQNYKQGRRGGLNPFGILEASNENDIYAELWREYYLATKGKRVIVWSDGLKKKYDIEQATDEQIADEANRDLVDEVKSVLLYVDGRDWKNKVCACSDYPSILKTCTIAEAIMLLDALGVCYGGGEEFFAGASG